MQVKRVEGSLDLFEDEPIGSSRHGPVYRWRVRLEPAEMLPKWPTLFYESSLTFSRLPHALKGLRLLTGSIVEFDSPEDDVDEWLHALDAIIEDTNKRYGPLAAEEERRATARRQEAQRLREKFKAR